MSFGVSFYVRRHVRIRKFLTRFHRFFVCLGFFQIASDLEFLQCLNSDYHERLLIDKFNYDYGIRGLSPWERIGGLECRGK